MAFGEDGDQGEAEDVVFAADDAAETVFEFRGAARGCYQSFGSHFGDSTMRAEQRPVTDVTSRDAVCRIDFPCVPLCPLW